jgi:hypothetical protein
MKANTTQITVKFNEDLDGIGNCEVTATVFLGRVTINSVRRNSDYAFETIDAATRRNLSRLAGWYAEDRAAELAENN